MFVDAQMLGMLQQLTVTVVAGQYIDQSLMGAGLVKPLVYQLLLLMVALVNLQLCGFRSVGLAGSHGVHC